MQARKRLHPLLLFVDAGRAAHTNRRAFFTKQDPSLLTNGRYVASSNVERASVRKQLEVNTVHRR